MNLVSRRLWVLVLLIVGCRVGIVQIDGDDLLLGLGLELMRQLVPIQIVVLDVETVLTIVLAGSWQILRLLLRVFIDVVADSLALKDLLATLDILLDWVRLVLSDARSLLLEVNVDCDGLYVVERIIFIERKTEIALVIHSRARYMLLGPGRLVLPGTHVDTRVRVHHLRGRLEASSLIIELLLLDLSLNVAEFRHFGLQGGLDGAGVFGVRAGTGLFVEVFLQLELTVEAEVLRVKRGNEL